MATNTFTVTGMTCGHCVSSVAEEVGKITGVQDVEVDLVAGGESRVTVTSAGDVAVDEVRAAVDEAGYELTRTPA
ncbi:cation transporter [Georgenia satyanarayanai]|uniref:heavy-metal-associated domain-containing protein n=1 Tax=Georgenia satyanarayanai TaxID=860221 RepID=UPI00203BC202|nr:cation transporter [Georgenia satyanarayanai]MCM3659809.1 cation transporter [Georgenia satyanarayanai]